MNSSEAEPLIVRRQSPLQLLIVDEPTTVLVRHLEACHHVGVRPRRKSRRHKQREGTSEPRRRRRIPSHGRWRRLVAGASVGLVLLRGFLSWGCVRRRWSTIGCGHGGVRLVALWRRRTIWSCRVRLRRRRRTVAVAVTWRRVWISRHFPKRRIEGF